VSSSSFEESDVLIRKIHSIDLTKVVDLYCRCFSEPPWHEQFNTEEVLAEFQGMISRHNTIFLVTLIDGRIVGVILSFPLEYRPDISVLVPANLQDALYLSELFVDAGYRNKGVARKLIEIRNKIALQMGFVSAVVRTSIDQPIIRNIYSQYFGFKVVAEQDVVSHKVIDGQVRKLSDRRVIMAGNITK